MEEFPANQVHLQPANLTYWEVMGGGGGGGVEVYDK